VAAWPSAAVVWNGPWRSDPSGADAGEVPASVRLLAEAGRDYGIRPVIVLGWREGDRVLLSVPEDPTASWQNGAARSRFQAVLAELAAAYQPPFLFLGSENDFYYAQDPADYARWVDFYNAAYEVIKAASPATQVGPVFNYEHLAGLGVLNGWDQPQWGALEAHDLRRIDVLGLSVYPWMVAASPDELPADYFAPLQEHAPGLPVAITETGWPAEMREGLEVPWQVSAAAQTAYLSWLEAALSRTDVRLVTWLYLYPPGQMAGAPSEWALFEGITLRDVPGNERLAYAVWRAFAP